MKHYCHPDAQACSFSNWARLPGVAAQHCLSANQSARFYLSMIRACSSSTHLGVGGSRHLTLWAIVTHRIIFSRGRWSPVGASVLLLFSSVRAVAWSLAPVPRAAVSTVTSRHGLGPGWAQGSMVCVGWRVLYIKKHVHACAMRHVRVRYATWVQHVGFIATHPVCAMQH